MEDRRDKLKDKKDIWVQRMQNLQNALIATNKEPGKGVEHRVECSNFAKTIFYPLFLIPFIHYVVYKIKLYIQYIIRLLTFKKY